MAEQIVLSGESEDFHTVIEEWRTGAQGCTLETLPEFLRHLLEDYRHDYRTVAFAVGAGAVATAFAMSEELPAKLTGPQAGGAMWAFVRAWMYEGQETPLRITDYSKLLYPQMEADFTRIPTYAWEWLQQAAAEAVEGASEDIHPSVKGHWLKILNNVVPFGLKVESEPVRD